MTKLVISKDRISVMEAERYISGTMNAYKCTVTFSKDWDNMDRKIIFCADPTDALCDEVYACVPAPSMSMKFAIPNKIFQAPSQKIQVSATGSRKGKTDQTVALQTSWASLGRIIEGAVIPSCPDEPTETGHGIPAGGLKGQALLKASDDDYDVYWGDVEGFPVVTTSSTVNAPIGSVLYFAGELSAIPEGWALCNGQNGTPDLMGKVVIGRTDTPDAPTESETPDAVEAQSLSDTIETYPLYPIMNLSAEPINSDGKSAYDIAVENGFEGTEEEWLASLQGKSAYQFAVDAGYTGTEAEFGAMLKTLSVLPVVQDVVISGRSDIPSAGAGAFLFVNTSVAARSRSAIRFGRDYVYLDDSDSSKLRITTLGNKVYDCIYAEDGSFASIELVEVGTGGGASKASEVSFDDSVTKLDATNVQEAIEKLASHIPEKAESLLETLQDTRITKLTDITSVYGDSGAKVFHLLNVTIHETAFSDNLVYLVWDASVFKLYTLDGQYMTFALSDGTITGVTEVVNAYDDGDGGAPTPLPFLLLENYVFNSLHELEEAGVTQGAICYLDNCSFHIPTDSPNQVFLHVDQDFVKFEWLTNLVITVFSTSYHYVVRLDETDEVKSFAELKEVIGTEPKIPSISNKTFANVQELKAVYDATNTSVHLVNVTVTPTSGQSVAFEDVIVQLRYDDEAKTASFYQINGEYVVATYDDTGAFTSIATRQNGSDESSSFTFGDGLTNQDGAISVSIPVRGIFTQTEFDALPEQQRNSGLYIIDDSTSRG